MSETAHQAVFLSYASQDVAAALRICAALRAAGIEVWFDQDALVGGDAWDQKIRGQIGTCALFMPVISAATQERLEGYFRIEWKVAAERTHAMAAARAFLLPIVIDATRDADAHVPAEFRAVQWTKLPGGEVSAAFVARVQKLLGGSEPVGGALRPDVLTESRHEAAPTVQASSRRWLVPTIAGLAALIVLGLWQPWKKSPAPLPIAAQPPSDLASAAAKPAADAKSVAVLAFANMSAEKDTEYFSDGISEEILNALANNPSLRVAGRTSSFSFKGKNATHVEIGRALNVARVIEGSVRKAGNKVRITVQLINAADGIQLWSEKFDKEMTDIFAVQSEIATTVAQKLAGGSATAAATVTVAAGAETKNLAAYDAYLRGRAAQTKGNSPAVLYGAMHHYEEALRLDPGYAMAWARLTQVYITIWALFDGTDELANKARTAVATAARLEPSLTEAHLALAAVQQWIDCDFDAAERELNQVERQRPNDAEVPAARAYLEFDRGNWGERLVALAGLAAERDPQNADSLCAMGNLLAAIGKFAEADRLLDGARSGQSFPAPFRMKALLRLTWTGEIAAALDLLETCPERLRNENFYLTLAEVIALRGDAAATFAAIDQARTALTREQPNFGRRDMETVATYRMGWHQARLGNPARAEELYTEALALAEKLAGEFPREPSPRFTIALIQARRGQKTTALAAAEEAMRLATRTHNAGPRVFPRQARAVVLARYGLPGKPGQEYHVSVVMHAEVLALLGETDAAIAELRALHEKGWAFGYRLRLGLEWEPLRGEAKFQQLMKEAEARADAQPRPKK